MNPTLKIRPIFGVLVDFGENHAPVGLVRRASPLSPLGSTLD